MAFRFFHIKQPTVMRYVAARSQKQFQLPSAAPRCPCTSPECTESECDVIVAEGLHSAIQSRSHEGVRQTERNQEVCFFVEVISAPDDVLSVRREHRETRRTGKLRTARMQIRVDDCWVELQMISCRGSASRRFTPQMSSR